MAPALRTAAAHVFVDSLAEPVLDEVDLHHLTRVLRIRPDDVITVSDGHDQWAPAHLRDGLVQICGAVVTAPGRATVTIATAIPKGDRAEWMVQKMSELGVGRVVLLECERSVVRWDAARAERQVGRLRRIAREAAMQSRQVRVPEIVGVRRFADVVAGIDTLGRSASATSATTATAAVIADPSGAALLASDVPVTVLIGPEGGFTPAELECGLPLVSLSPHVLRIETAAIAAAVLVGSYRL